MEIYAQAARTPRLSMCPFSIHKILHCAAAASSCHLKDIVALLSNAHIQNVIYGFLAYMIFAAAACSNHQSLLYNFVHSFFFLAVRAHLPFVLCFMVIFMLIIEYIYSYTLHIYACVYVRRVRALSECVYI